MVTKKFLILVVEDEASLRAALKTKLAKEGYEVLEAANGLLGLDLALAKHPDLILLDIIMPVMDGMTMLGKLRQDHWGRSAKVIVLTNLSDTEKEVASEKEGVVKYLVKTNWRLEDLIKQVKLILR